MTTNLDIATLRQAHRNARNHLLALRSPLGHWEGELSASALSTATAVCALDQYQQALASESNDSNPQLESLVENGRRWLAEHQNVDGGWGDTIVSFSNISTTALCWAALAGAEAEHPQSVASAAAWLARTAGSLDPPVLAVAIKDRYGKDRTFSVPILTTLAITGRLGDAAQAWRLVPQLPFELAACPHRWFAWLRLPVVSYALPALIAMGQARHFQRPSINPLTRLIRNLVRGRTLRVLRSIQPTTGGFLEATPLTSFVALSLIAAGLARNPVVQHSVAFLVDSVRPDGSWPIDTNLATWVTTLSVGALAGPAVSDKPREATELDNVRRWLLDQQYQVEHPYTHAAPGGWAWTDLSGGVPDADDTAGALLALKALDDGRADLRQVAADAVGWLLNLQNNDGGIPTFCRGWGALPFDRSSSDITAHAIRAWITWRDELPGPLQAAIARAVRRAIEFLTKMQREDGAWAPLWFGNQHGETEANLTYGTSRVLLALSMLRASGELPADIECKLERAVDWLCGIQNEDGGWGGAAGTPSSVEETALALEALCSLCTPECEKRVERKQDTIASRAAGESIRRGLVYLIDATSAGTTFTPSPIGFYFAKLWYYESLYPVVFAVAALSRACAVGPELVTSAAARAGADA